MVPSWRQNLPTLVGLSIPLGVTAWSIAAYLHPKRLDVLMRGIHQLADGSYFVEPSSRSIMEVGMTGQLLIDLALITALLLLVSFWERKGLASVGLRWPSGRDLVATVAVCLLWFPIVIAIGMLLPVSLQADQRGLAALVALPLWLRLLLLLISPFQEELLFKAYLIERVEKLTGSTWLAFGVSVLSNTLAHLTLWGGGALASIAPGIAILSGFYIWRRNLPASTALHVVADSPIVWLPILLSRWR